MEENKYTNGKIYKVVSDKGEMVYIGSTVQSLEQRFSEHKSAFRIYQNDIKPNRSIFQMFDEYGVESCVIELIEDYPCECKFELLKREGYHMRKNNCFNRCIAGRSKSDYFQENREYMNEKKVEWKKRNYEHHSQQQKDWREINREIIREKKNEKHDCPCGGKYTHGHKALHMKSKKHQKYLEQ